jgi:hypothetical protein
MQALALEDGEQQRRDEHDLADKAKQEVNEYGIKIFDPAADRERDIRLKRRVRYQPNNVGQTHETWYRQVPLPSPSCCYS